MYKIVRANRWMHRNGVMVVGCGGTGAFVADGLCRILPKSTSIILVDPDMVEERNLGRQFFARRDIGKFKAAALASRLADFYDRDVQYLVGVFDGFQNIPSPELVIGCVDNALARKRINECCNGVWYIDAGNDYNSGQVFIGNASAEGSRHTFGPDFFVGLPLPAVQCPALLTPTVKPRVSCAEALVLEEQSPVINQMMASLVLLFVHKFLLSELTWMAAYIDLVTGTLTPVQAEPKRIAKLLGFKVDSLFVKPPKQKEKAVV